MSDEKISRNEPCPCGSGLKHKKCHGDVSKQQTIQRVAAICMQRMIHFDRYKAGLETEDELLAALKALNYRVVDFDKETLPEVDSNPEPETEFTAQESDKRLDRKRDPEAFRKAAGL